MSNDVLSVAEAASLLGTTRQAVNKAIAKGTLSAAPVIERGKVVRYVLDADVVEQRAGERFPIPGCLNVEAAAEHIGVSNTTMSKYMAEGLVAFDRNSLGVVSIKIDDLDAIVRPKLGRPLKEEA